MERSLKSSTILYVEDDTFTREGYVRLFKRLFKEVYSASDGENGLSIFKNKSPDIVVTDSKMPVMDGFEMSQKIREIDKAVPIIFISADSQRDFVKSLEDININCYLVKPISRDELKEMLKISINQAP